MKKLALFFIITTFVTGTVFAQEDGSSISRVSSNYIRPTVALGFAVASGTGFTETGFTPSFDIDFVHNTGLTLGFQYTIFGHRHYATTIPALGIGYTFDAGDWSAGGKFMFVPVEAFFFGTWGVGFDINGTYWLQENLGITAIINLYFPDDVFIFSLRTGVSLRF